MSYGLEIMKVEARGVDIPWVIWAHHVSNAPGTSLHLGTFRGWTPTASESKHLMRALYGYKVYPHAFPKSSFLTLRHIGPSSRISKLLTSLNPLTKDHLTHPTGYKVFHFIIFNLVTSLTIFFRETFLSSSFLIVHATYFMRSLQDLKFTCYRFPNY